eukprot:Sspe_Gene.85927::Locus_56672_Transcript_2_2_Confidence_0.250_Length_1404::g.85927::m.85927
MAKRERDAIDVSTDELKQAGEAGLRNPLGDNNCFLNSVLQAMYHTDDFRDAVITKYGEPVRSPLELLNSDVSTPPPPIDPAKKWKKAKGRLLRELARVLLQYQKAGGAPVDPTTLRGSMAVLLPQYEKGNLQDAHECFEFLLGEVDEACKEEGTGSALAKHCYGIDLRKEAVCPSCNKVERTTRVECYSLTMWASELTTPGATRRTFVEGLKGVDEPITCDCGTKISVKTKLGSGLPQWLTVNVSWGSSEAKRSQLRQFLSSVPLRFPMTEAIHGSGDEIAVLNGMVFYYGQHYISTFFNRERRVWVIFDDDWLRAVARSISGLWKYVVDGCIMPLMLFYRIGLESDDRIQEALSYFRMAAEGEPEVMKDDYTEGIMLEWLEANTRSDVNLSDSPSYFTDDFLRYLEDTPVKDTGITPGPADTSLDAAVQRTLSQETGANLPDTE